ncbi:MAG: MFS transporter [Gammaproteobacteria bacterium]|nr:MAG: MFS transporter [Gammaproteobacteria bacterium]
MNRSPAAGQSGTRRLALLLLFLVSLFNYMDRYMLAVLLPAIKAELALSDAQAGLLTGLAFTLFYATLGIPIARLADRYSRRRIIALALGFWSAMTAACGLVQGFWQLLAARVLVGAGEAGASPPSHSLIADLYRASERARALSIYALGAPVGILVGFALGGWLVAHYDWRVALLAVATPGLLLSLLVYRRLPEPQRGASDGLTAPPEIPALLPTFGRLLGTPSFRQVSLATGLYTVLWLGVVQWLPSFFTRSFGLGIAEVGAWLAVILSGSQIVGMFFGGVLADRLGRRDLRWYCWLPALAIALSTPAFIVTFSTSDPGLAYATLCLPFAIGIVQGPASFAVVQGVADVGTRATAAALLLLITNLIGGGIGPWLVGYLSDSLAASAGPDALRRALLWVALCFGLWSAAHYAWAARHLRRDFRSAH